MEQQNFLEQPVNSNSQSVENTSTIEGEQDGLNGSILGKFKNVKELESAYQNLQSEFTKKSQKLSEVLKSDNLANATADNANISTAKNGDENAKPQFEGVAWQETVTNFLKQNPVAKNYASEITSLLASDSELAKLPNALDVAYWKVLATNFKSEQDFLNDEKFVSEKILNNEKIIQKVLKKYVDGIQKTPAVIGTHAGTSVGRTPPERPKSLKEASEVFARMLKTK